MELVLRTASLWRAHVHMPVFLKKKKKKQNNNKPTKRKKERLREKMFSKQGKTAQ